MASFTSVLCALDRSQLAPRVLSHAVAIAGAAGAKLTVVSVFNGNPNDEHARIDALLAATIPPGAPYITNPRVRVMRVTQGDVADAVIDAASEDCDLLVAGTQAKSGIARWFLGSTSAALLERATCPTLLIPPDHHQTVTLTPTEAILDIGTVMAAVDLAEHNTAQIVTAHRMAEWARAPLILLTVIDPGTSASDAEQALFDRAHVLEPGSVREVIVRTGLVAEEIEHAAASETAGLVVMGLRERSLGVPGGIATAVLKAKNAMVLAVPAI
jgi:nucleotide-binding universal stress UspA family protein